MIVLYITTVLTFVNIVLLCKAFRSIKRINEELGSDAYQRAPERIKREAEKVVLGFEQTPDSHYSYISHDNYEGLVAYCKGDEAYKHWKRTLELKRKFYLQLDEHIMNSLKNWKHPVWQKK